MRYSQKKIKLLLEKEVEKSQAPVTGYLIACALITEKNIYFGHNFEREDSFLFDHAEPKALEKALENEKNPSIIKIIMLARGKIKKFKNFVPCSVCSKALAPYMKPESILELLPFNTTARKLELKFRDILGSYAKLEYSKFQNVKKEKIIDELHQKTFLKERDAAFVCDLMLLAKEQNIKLCLTGSSSGRGAVSNILMKKTKSSYHDIDIIIILEASLVEEIQQNIEKLINNTYFSYKLEDGSVLKHQNKKNVVLKKIIYHIENETILDITLATNMDGAFRKPQYYEGNWYHQLV